MPQELIMQLPIPRETNTAYPSSNDVKPVYYVTRKESWKCQAMTAWQPGRVAELSKLGRIEATIFISL